MKVMGLDVATVSGWAVLEDGVPSAWGQIDCTPSKGDPEGVRYKAFSDQVGALLVSRRPDIVAIEEGFARGRAATRVLYGLTAVATVQLEIWGMEYVFCMPHVWKSHVANHGRASKEQVREALNGWSDITPDLDLTDNESDALALAKWLHDHAEVV